MPKEEQQQIQVLISREGEYAVNTDRFTAMDKPALTAMLAGFIGVAAGGEGEGDGDGDGEEKGNGGGERQLPVIIAADARAPHEAVVRVMDVAAELGLTRLSISTVRSDANP